MNWEGRKADLLDTLKAQAEELQQTLATYEALGWRHREEERLCDGLGLKDCVLRHDLIKMEMVKQRRGIRKQLFSCISTCFPDKNVVELEKWAVNSEGSWRDFEGSCKCHRICVHAAVTILTKVTTDMQEAGIQIARSHLSTRSVSPISSYF